MNLEYHERRRGEFHHCNGRDTRHHARSSRGDAANKTRSSNGKGNGNSRRSGRGYLVDPDLSLRFGLSCASLQLRSEAAHPPQAPEFTEGSASRALTRLDLAKQVSFCAHQGTVTLNGL